MEPSTRTPEGQPNRCPICGKEVRIEPSWPPGDAPCPHCGHLLWFAKRFADVHVTKFPWWSRLSFPGGRMPEGKEARQAGYTLRGRRQLAGVRGAAVVGFVLGLFTLVGVGSGDRDLPPAFWACAVVATTIVSAIAGLGLSLRDCLRDRLQKRQRVNMILRAYFVSGFVSLVLWIGTAIGLVVVLGAILELIQFAAAHLV